MLATFVACAEREPAPVREAHPMAARAAATATASALASASPAPLPAPACPEIVGGAWPRADAPSAVRRGRGGALGTLEQARDGRSVELRFLGAHLFDLLGKIDTEGGATERSRRELVCAALDDVAARGAPVVRIWGSLKRTGDDAEVARAVALLALVLDENARRTHPLRFVVALLDHQAGWGAPDPSRSLDDQDPATGWDARTVYLRDGWRVPGRGLLATRIGALAASDAVRSSPYVLAWELVNELDVYRIVPGGVLRGAIADTLRDRFAVPALSLLASSLPQPVALGELRAAPEGYEAFASGLVGALPPPARDRFVWVSHAYVDRDAGAESVRRATGKLDRDLAIASAGGLPLLLGELGQRAPGAPRFCGDGPAHDVGALIHEVLDAPAPSMRGSIDEAIFWGEGECRLALPGGARVNVGAGGDSADLSPGDHASRDALVVARRWARFTTTW